MIHRNIPSLWSCLGLCGLLALGACSRSASKSASTSDSLTVRSVECTPAELRSVEEQETYTTALIARTTNHISSQTGGRLSKLSVEIGSRVQRGQIVAQLEASALNQARVRLEDSRTSLARIDELYRVGGISKSSWEAARSAVDLAQEVFNNIQENTLLRSPISGVVTKKNYDVGDMTPPAQPIVVVEELSPVKAVVHVSETYFSYLRLGLAASIEVDALEGRRFEGRVSNIYPTVDPTTHTIGVEVEIPNADLSLRPGMYARITLRLGVRERLLIPERAIVRRAGTGERNVFVLSEGKALYRVVELGRLYGDHYEVLSGLKEGEQVICSSPSTLTPGTEVSVKHQR